ncbi:MAG: GWxTD domain-containing protein [Melioribacter sp.]|nr:GWxTD domain-containing protein [Melioribacter sp.]
MILAKTNILFLLILLFISIPALCIPLSTNCINTSYDGKEKTDLYLKGIETLNSGDLLSAEKYFKESIRKYGDAASYYELAKINLKKDTFLSRNIAYEHFRKAALLEPENLEYRYAFADLMKDFARRSSMKQYKEIISLDSNQINAYLSLGDMKANDFKEFNKSVRMESGVLMSVQEAANKDFKESEKYLLSALSKDTLNYDAIIKLGLLYERAGKPEKGIPLLNRLVRNKKDDKDVHLLLGLLYYKISKMKQSHDEYKLAINMMDKFEKDDFMVNSILFFFDQSEFLASDIINDENVDEIIESFWKTFDPLFLTEYNERLLEHYSRVAYANLNFSVPSLGLYGWSTDMGQTMIRYGDPLNRTRIRPSMNPDGTVNVKTELWNYEGINIAFTDAFSTGNYQYSWPASDMDKLRPQVPGNYVDFVNDLNRNVVSYYNPKFEGPKIDVPYSIIQFKSDKRNNTDLYLNYLIPDMENLNSDSLNYKIGFFHFDKKYLENFRTTFDFSVSRYDRSPKNLFVTLQPDSGYIAFEMIRNIDNGAFSSHRNFTVKKFNNIRQDISDLLIAGDVSTESKDKDYFKRNDIYVKPYVSNEFKKEDPVYLYYEIYNLEKDSQGLTNFEQSLIISEYGESEKSGLSKFFSSITNFLGITGEQKITLKSNYKTLEKNPQIYFQLDLNNFEPGEYQIKIVIKDNIAGNEKEIDRIIKWLK